MKVENMDKDKKLISDAYDLGNLRLENPPADFSRADLAEELTSFLN